jgi:hypothetical protein
MMSSKLALAAITSASPVIIPREDLNAGLVAAYTIALLFGIVFFVSFMTLMTALLPRTSRLSRSALTRYPWRCLLTGVIGYLVIGGLGWFFYTKAFIVRLLTTDIVYGMLAGGIAVVLVGLVVTFLGALGAVTYVGQRLGALSSEGLSELQQAVWGTLVGVLACFFPLGGWAVVTPGVLLFSFGAAVLGFWYRKSLATE